MLSRPGEGTTFEVYFPRLQAVALADAEITTETAVRRGQGETVLIVDDDKSLVLLGEEMLAALGYEPVGFDSSEAALAAFRADPWRFDLVLMDEVMPHMTGIELAAAIRESRSDLPLVLMTGDSRPLSAERIYAAGIRIVLAKPLLSKPLAECLARHLGKGKVSADRANFGKLERFPSGRLIFANGLLQRWMAACLAGRLPFGSA